MGNFLKENQKNEIRYQNKDIILYNPTKEEYEQLKEIMKNIVTDKENSISIDVKYIKEIFRMLVKGGNFVDDYTDEELITELENGNRKIQLLYQEIKDMIQDIIDDIIYECKKQTRDINTFINMINNNDDTIKTKDKINKFLKKKKININVDEIEKLIKENPETIKSIINKDIK
jgi:hypothetical protein